MQTVCESNEFYINAYLAGKAGSRHLQNLRLPAFPAKTVLVKFTVHIFAQ